MEDRIKLEENAVIVPCAGGDWVDCAFYLDPPFLRDNSTRALRILKSFIFGEYRTEMQAWRGHELALYKYAEEMLQESCERYVVRDWDAKLFIANLHRYEFQINAMCRTDNPPMWVHDMEVIDSHRAYLLRKNFYHYSEMFSEEGEMRSDIPFRIL